MLTLFNTLGRKTETFRPVNPRVVTVFTCGPSVYQPSHIGNFRTFLFEDIVVRYLEYLGYFVKRGMNFTDIEDKAIEEAMRRKTTVGRVTGPNIRRFVHEMQRLRMKVPDYLPQASLTVAEAAAIIRQLLAKGVAYRHRANIYFDPKKFRGFGRLYGLDMRQWPVQRRRFHRDTYPGMRWNRGDFILWHGCPDAGHYCWESVIGRGRPAWNVQDAGMVDKHFQEELSIYCGGIDNLVRHHDYSLAILESVHPYPMARYWLHCSHLHVNGKKMSKSKGNIYYTDTLTKKGYSLTDIRFFLIYGHYRSTLNYSDRSMQKAAERLGAFRKHARQLARCAGSARPNASAAARLEALFSRHMNSDLDLRSAFDALAEQLSAIDPASIPPAVAAGCIKALRRIDTVLQVIF